MPVKPPAEEVKLYFFGAPLIQRCCSDVPVDRQKAIALLAYLLLTGHRHRRDVLANLLWPDLDQPRARAGLRRVLRTLRSAIGSAHVSADYETVGLRMRESLWSDVTDFQQRLANARAYAAPGGLDTEGQLLLEEAVALYRADLLAGFNLRDAPDFENWLCIEREALRRAMTSALAMLVRLHTGRGSYGPAVDFAQRWLALEPADERAHQALIDLYLRSGDPVAARRQYEVCTRVLAEEMGFPPGAETQLLAASIDAGVVLHRVQPAETAIVALPFGETRLATVLVTGPGPAEEGDAEFGAAGEERIQRQARCMQSIRDQLCRFGAYIPLYFGDKVVAIFGIPSSHEDDPERAVRAALGLQRGEIAGLRVATGVHTGMVYLQGMPAAATQQTVILGSAVDIALRLCATADVGETLVTPATQRLTLGAVAYAARNVILTGTRTSSSVYSAEGLQPFMRKARGIRGISSSLVGRGQEIAGLLDAVRRVLVDGTGCLIQIGGAPGVGKSRLVAELYARLQIEAAAEITWLEGRCAESTSDTAYGPFREILRAFARFLPEDPEDVKVARLNTLLVTLWQRAGLPRAQLGEVTPFLGNLLSLPEPHRKVAIAALAAEEIHYRTVEAIATFVAALGRSTPTVLVVEDLQWADPHSLVVVHQVAAKLAEFPLALVCVTRPEPHTLRSLEIAARVCPQRTLVVHLADLSPHESRQLVEQLLHLPSVPPALDPLVIARTEGNPFYIEESLPSLIDADVLVENNGTWSVDESRLRQVTDVTSDQVPQAVQSVLLSRIDSQPPHIRKALHAAAVVGREVPLALYSRLLPAGTNLAALVPALEQTGFLLANPAHPHAEVMFRHVLQQMVAYQTVGSAERRALHGQVAQAIASLWPEQEAENVEQLAYHYSRSDDTGKAVEYLARAGARAQQLFLNATAIASYEQALALLGQIADRDRRRTEQARLLASLGRVQHMVGDFAAAAQNLGQAFDRGLTTDLPAPELVRWAYWQADALYWAGDAQAALAACEHAFATLPIMAESQETAMLNQQMAGAYLSLGPKERFVAISLQTAEYILQLPFSEELASPYHHVIDACLAGKEVDRAWVFIDALHSHAEAAGNFRALAKAEFIAARTCAETGRHMEALVHGEKALVLAQKTGDVATIQFCLSRLVTDALVLGRLDDADRYGQLEHHYAVESGQYGGEWLMLVGANQLALNQVAAASTVLEQSRVVGADIGYPVCDEATLWLGRAYQRMGRTEDAISQFRAVLWNTRPSMPSPPFMPDAKPVFLLALAALNELVPDPEQFARVVDPLCTGPWHDEPYFTHAYLVHTPRPAGEPQLRSIDPSASEWQWVDPLGDCTWSLHNGTVEVRAANGRDLWWTNLSAPRLLLRFAGDLCLQATCTPAADNTPALGGLLIWGDGRNYLRLDLSSGGRSEIVFMGCLEGRDIVIGRGRLPTDPIMLRVERKGSRVDSFCSNDGSTWYTVGSIDFVGGPVAAGLYAIGLIDRTIYPGAYPDGSHICFTDLRTRSALGSEP